MTLIDLYDIVLKEHIDVYHIHLNKLNGLYLENNIFINSNIKNENKEKLVLAEELGHYFGGVYPTLPFSTDYYNKLIRSKNEFKAKKWLINEIIPFNTLKSLLEQNMSKFDIAEKLDVSASLIEDAFNIYSDNLKDVIFNEFD